MIRISGRTPGVAPTILATVAVVFALEWAQGFVIFLLLGILFAYTLNSLVVTLERIRIPPRGGCRDRGTRPASPLRDRPGEIHVKDETPHAHGFGIAQTGRPGREYSRLMGIPGPG